MSENNEYYAEKMRRLLDKQKKSVSAGSLGPGGAKKIIGRKAEQSSDERDFSFDENKRPKQQHEEIKEEEREDVRAELKARRKRMWKIISTAALLIATVIIGVFVVYKIFFVIRSISVEGASIYTSEQVLAAVGVDVGDNLYSFSSRVAEEKIQMYCPEVGEVTVKRTPPGKIVITVVEEEAVYWADFYGEIRALTGDLRVLGVIREEQKDGLVKIKLPEVQRAVAGEEVRVSDESAAYIFEVAEAIAQSELCDRIGTVDLTAAHDIRMTCDGKYIMKLGEYHKAADKLRIAAEVLKDDMFNSENKATIDLSDVSQTGVVVDNQLVIE